MYRLVCVLIAALVIAQPARGQTTANGSIRGVVKDQQNAVLPGVVVSVTSRTVPGVRTMMTDDVGRYRLLDLPPGDYALAAELPGFSRFFRTPVTVRAGLNLELDDIVMTVGSIDEVVEVTLDTPLLETRNGGNAVNISGELLRAMPLSERREWFGAVLLAPGVATAEWINNEKLLYVHGADSSSNIVQIDGADMTGSLTSSLRYLNLNLDAVDDVQIKTAGLDASAPLGLGGVVNVATASGTNQLRGAGTLFFQPRQWNASNTPGGTSSTIDQTQLDLSAGAPFMKDHLWGFGAYRYTDASSGVSRSPAQLDALRGLVPGFAPFDSTNLAHFWFAKVTAQLSPSHQISSFYQYDVNPVSFADPVTENQRSEATGGTGVSVRLSSIWSSALTTRIGLSYNDKRRDGLNNQADRPQQRVYQSTIVSAGRPVGNGRVADLGSPVTGWSTNPNSKVTLALDATLLVDRWLGSHELQSGIYAQPRNHVEVRDFYPNGGFVFEEAVLRQPGVYTAGVVPFHRVVLEGETLTRVQRRAQDYALYIQDAWRPTSRLTINAGVRVDWVTWTDLIFDATTQRSTEVGPRLGINYALTSDARNIVKAHWVRIHDQPAQTGSSLGTAAVGQRDLYDLDLNGTFETTLVTPPTFAITPNRSIDPGFHQPFVNEWGTGYRRQFDGAVAAGVDVVHRDYRDRGTLIETNGRYNGTVFTGYFDESFNEIYQVTNNRWNWPVFTSLEFSLSKRTTRIQGIASYVRQWRHIAGTWQPNDPASFIQPSAFDNDRGIGNTGGSTASTADTNSLSGTHMTQRATGSAQWQDHVVRVGVTYSAPWKLLLATNYTFQSGAWSGPIVSRLTTSDPAFGPATITLSNGRAVTNPLATAFRFAYPTRAEGQLTTPHLHVWNLRAGREVSWNRFKLDASIDLFNVTNSGSDASFDTGANQTFNPNYGLTTYRQLPRSAQAVLRFSF